MQSRGIDEIISQLRAAEVLAAGRPPEAAPARLEGDAAVDFAGALKAALDRVNSAQSGALAAAREFETGDKDVGLHEVMIAMQKANVAFQATVQVRNRLVSAYQDIMNMPI